MANERYRPTGGSAKGASSYCYSMGIGRVALRVSACIVRGGPQPGNCMNVAAEFVGLTNVFLYSATESPESHLTIIFPTRQRPNVPCARYTTTGIRRSAVGATSSAAVLARGRRGALDALHFVPRDRVRFTHEFRIVFFSLAILLSHFYRLKIAIIIIAFFHNANQYRCMIITLK